MFSELKSMLKYSILAAFITLTVLSCKKEDLPETEEEQVVTVYDKNYKFVIWLNSSYCEQNDYSVFVYQGDESIGSLSQCSYSSPGCEGGTKDFKIVLDLKEGESYSFSVDNKEGKTARKNVRYIDIEEGDCYEWIVGL